MEAFGQILGGLGLLGIVAAVLLGTVLVLILPWWAIVECVRAPRDSGVKAFLVVALILTWGLGSLVYGLFVTRSRALRIFTGVAVVVLVGIGITSLLSLGTGFHLAATAQEEARRAEIEALSAGFRPRTLAEAELEPFHALHFVSGGVSPAAVSLASFTLAGLDPASARDTDRTVRHLALDARDGRFFALTRHDFGTITPSTGRFARIEVDPSLDHFGWPKGIAVDTKSHRVLVLTSHVATRFFSYDPRTSDWQRLPSEIRDLPVVGLAYSPGEDCLYAVEEPFSSELAVRRIHRFNTDGASLASIELQPPIPMTRERRDLLQLNLSSGWLVLVSPAAESEGADAEAPTASRVFAIDPRSGEVAIRAPSPPDPLGQAGPVGS